MPVSFNSVGAFSGVNGGPSLSNPTSLQFGPDGRLYVSEQNGSINAFTVEKQGDTWVPTNGEELLLPGGGGVVKSIQNHNDDGTPVTGNQLGGNTNNRQVTGIVVTGTADEPVLYISSSDPRISTNGDVGLDTNSGVVSKVSWNSTTQEWEVVDLVRGLPRSEENHSVNGMILTENGTKLLLQVGGFTNNGAPSGFFSYTNEYALSGTVLELDLVALDALPDQIDPEGGQGSAPRTYKYDLPTLDDPNIANAPAELSDQEALTQGFRENSQGMDLDGPHGGNDGLNMAILPADAPLRLYADGLRNAYDLAQGANGLIYTVDNGSNGNLGAAPNPENGDDDGDGNLNEAIATPNNGGQGEGEPFHQIVEGGYYYHPAPVRANQNMAWTVYGNNAQPDSNVGVNQVDDISALVPAQLLNDGVMTPGFLIDPTKFAVAPGVTLADLSPQEQAERLALSGIWINSNQLDNPNFPDPDGDGPGQKTIAQLGASTNGIVVYDSGGAAFGGSIDGAVFVTQFNDNLTLLNVNDAGTDLEPIFAEGPDGLFGTADDVLQDADGILQVANNSTGVPLGNPLDVTQGPNGTLWVAEIGSNEITVLEPSLVLDPANEDADFDGILNKDDPFSRDATNGTSVTIAAGTPTVWEFSQGADNTTPGPDGFGGGLTGAMINGETDFEAFYLEQDPNADPGVLRLGNVKFVTAALGGTTTIEEVSNGDPLGTTNDGEFLFHTGFILDQAVETFTVSWNVANPAAITGGSDITSPEQQIGGYLGDGTQSNYLKIVAVQTEGGPKIRLVLEEAVESGPFFAPIFTDTVIQTLELDAPGLFNDQTLAPESFIKLDLLIDLTAKTATPQATYQTTSGEVTITGGPNDTIDLAPGGVNSAVLTTFLGGAEIALGEQQGIAAGLFSSNTGSDNDSFQAVFDSITVSAPEAEVAPVAVDDDVTTQTNALINIPVATLLANDTDANSNEVLTVTGVSNAVNGQVNLNNGVVTFTPDQDFQGDATFDYTVEDSTGLTDTGSVTVTVANEVVLYRVNAGGNVGGPGSGTIAAIDGGPDWINDATLINSTGPVSLTGATANTFSNSLTNAEDEVEFLNGANAADSAIAPWQLFVNERGDNSAADPKLTYNFDVTPSETYKVSLFYTENWNNIFGFTNGTTGGKPAGQSRQFDVEVEGVVPVEFDGINPLAESAALVGSAPPTANGAPNSEKQPFLGVALQRDYVVTAEDDTLNVVFNHEFENPKINAIQIAQVGSAIDPVDPIPVLNILNANQTVTEGETAFISIATDITVPNDEIVTFIYVIEGVTATPEIDYSPDDSLNGVGTATFTGTGTITGGSSDFQIPVDTLPDELVEGAETFTVTITSVSSNATLGSNSAATVTIDDNDIAPGAVVVAINAGGPALNQDGIDFAADQFFDNGNTFADGNAGNGQQPVFDGTVYETERFGGEAGGTMSYSIPVPNGDYTVELYFAEIFQPNGGGTGIGARVFDVTVEGQLVLDDFDILEQTGGNFNQPVVFTVPGVVSPDGGGDNPETIDINFSASADNAKISGIVIRDANGNVYEPPLDDLFGTAIEIADTGDAPSGPVTLAEGSNVMSATQEGEGDGANGVRDRDYFTVEIPDGFQLTGVVLNGYDNTNQAAPDGFLAFQQGDEVPVDPTTGANVNELQGAIIYGAGNVGTDLLDSMRGGFNDPQTNTTLPAFDQPLTGTWTFWLNQGAGPSTATLDFIVEPLAASPVTLSIADAPTLVENGDVDPTTLNFALTASDPAFSGEVTVAYDQGTQTGLTTAVTFTNGAGTLSIEVPSDDEDNGDETVAITLTSADDGATTLAIDTLAGSATGIVTEDDDAPVATTIRFQAEDFDASVGYGVQTQNAAEEDEVAFLPSGGASGSATYDLAAKGAVPGVYNLTIGYFDENDGESNITVSVDGVAIGSFTLDDDATSGNAAQTSSFRTKTFTNVTVGENGQLVIAATTDAGEFARTDWIQLVPVDGDGGGPDNTAPFAPFGLADQSATAAGEFAFDAGALFADNEEDALTFTVATTTLDGTLDGNLPVGVSFDPATGIFGGAPSVQGEYQITVTANDGALDSVPVSFALTVTEVNEAPVVDAEIANQTLELGEALALDVTGNFSDPNLGDELVYTVAIVGPDGATELPGITFVDGAFDGTVADSAAPGSYQVTVTASDGEEAVPDSFLINVTGDVGDGRDTVRIEAEDFELVNGFFEEAGSRIRLLANSAGEATYALNQIDGLSGDYDVSVTFFDESDGVSSATLSYDDGSGSGFVELGNWSFDQDGGGNAAQVQNLRTLIFSGLAYSPNGVLKFAGQSNAGEFLRTDFFELIPVGSDGGPNFAPTEAGGGIPDTTVQGLGLIDLDASTAFSDSEDDPLIYAKVAGPDWVTVDSATGAITGEPPAGGEYEITVSATDAQNNPNLPATSTFTLTVEVPDNAPPTLTVTPVLTEISEDADVAASTKVADITVTDDGIGINNLALTGDDAALFEIVDNNGMQELHLVAGVALDFAANPALDVSVTLDDPALGTGIEASAAVSVAVTDADDPTGEQVVLRINAFGPQVVAIDGGPDWLADGDGTNAGTGISYLSTTDSRGDAFDGYDGDPTLIPTGVPEAVLDTARSSNAPFSYDIPVDDIGGPGTFRVNLYIAELFAGGQTGGFRIFDASLEGAVPVAFDNIDPGTDFGPGGNLGVLSAEISVDASDGVLNIGLLQDLVDGAQNPIVNAIEVVRIGDPAPDTEGPTAAIALTNPADANAPLFVAVTLTDDTGIDPASLGDADLLVSGGGAVSFDGFSNGVATYTVAAPVDGWQDDAAVDVTLQDGAIADTLGNVSTATSQSITLDIGGGTGTGGDAIAVLAGLTDVTTDATYGTGVVGSAELRIMEGNNGIQSSNFGNNSFQVVNTGGKNIAAIVVEVGDALYPDIVFDPDGAGGDSVGKALTINTQGGTGAFTTGTGYVLPGADPLPNTTGTGVASNGGFKGALLKFTDFGNGETVGFSGDMDPNSIAGLPKSIVDNGTILGWDVGGVSGLEMIGSTFAVLFDDGTTATGVLTSDGSVSGAQALADQGAPAPEIIGLTVNGTSEGALGTYGSSVPTVIVTGDPGETVRVTMTKGFNPVTNTTGGVAQLVEARLADDDFNANNAFDSQTIDVVIPGSGSIDIGGQFDYNDAVAGAFAGDNIADITFVAAAIDPQTKFAKGPATAPIVLKNQGGPVDGGSVDPVEGYFEIVGTGNAAYFKMEIEDANVANGGQNPGGKWNFVSTADGDGNQSGFTGDGYYLYGSDTSTALNNVIQSEVLEYTIFVPEGETGNFNFQFRVSRDGEAASDQQNDLWLNFKPAAEPGNGDIEAFLTNVSATQEPEPVNNGYIKIFGGPNNGNWGTASNYDGVPGNPQAQINIAAPGFYTIQIAGRSQGFHVDSFWLAKSGGSTPGASSANSTFVPTGDTVPTVVDPIDDVQLVLGNDTIITAADAFQDLDGDTLGFTANFGGIPAGQASINPDSGEITLGSGIGLGSYTVAVTATDDDGGSATDTFVVDVVEQPTGSEISASIASSADDWEQFGGGTSADFELGFNSGQQQWAALRFTGIDIPDGATVTDAVIRFTAQEDSTGAASFTIALQDSETAAPFSTANLPTATGRNYSPVVAWNSVPAWVDGETYDTPNLASIFNGVIGVDGVDGGAFAFLIQGVEGARVADAFETSGGVPAELLITYDFTNGGGGPGSGGGPGNAAPEITGGATASVQEGTTVALDVDATDLNGDPLTYSISGGADADLFGINSATGEVTFNAAPDFENPVDAGGNNVYNLQVSVSDGLLSDSQSYAITVTDDPSDNPGGSGPALSFAVLDNSKNEIDPLLEGGDSYELGALGGSIEFTGTITDGTIGSALLEIEDAGGNVVDTKIENVSPYDIVWQGGSLTPGDYTLVATSFAGNGTSGDQLGVQTIAFSILPNA
ncbi:MAG: malectin domain-containing carbohydrate-binding protein [Leptolyngbyaceae cyanobacterium]